MKKTISFITAMALSISSIGSIQAFAVEIFERGTVTVTVIDAETNTLFDSNINFSILGDSIGKGEVYLGSWNTSKNNPHTFTDAPTNFDYMVTFLYNDFNGYGYRIDEEKSEESFDFSDSTNKNITIYMEKYWFDEPVEYSFDEILAMDEESYKKYCNKNELEYTAPDVIESDLEKDVQISVMINPQRYLNEGVKDVLVTKRLEELCTTNMEMYNFKNVVNNIGLPEKYFDVNVNEAEFEVVSEIDYITDIENPTSNFHKLINVLVGVKDKYIDSEEYIRLNQIMRSLPEKCEDFHSFSIRYAGENNKNHIPNWVPDNYDEAVEFYNNYGATHIEDGLICITLLKDSLYYNYDVAIDANKAEKIYHNLYHHSLLIQNDIEILLFKPFSNVNFSVKMIESSDGVENYSAKYTFDIDENGEIAQTDFYSFIPDCQTEFNAFVKKYGKASIHDEYIVYVPDVNDEKKFEFSVKEQGTSKLGVGEIFRSFRIPSRIAIANNTDSIYIYKPTTEGVLDVNWIVKEQNKKNLQSDIRRKYEIDENGVITDITSQLITGDLNSDNSFSIADAVMLQSWLLGKSDVTLSDWKAADFCNDDNIDVYDLIEMKEALID